MRKAISTVMCGLLILLLCACGQPGATSSPPDFPEEFHADAAVSVGDYTILSHVQYAPDYLELAFQSPAVLQKLKMTYNGDACSVSYDNLSVNLDVSRFPEAAFGRVIVQAMRKCVSRAEITTEFTGTEWLYRGKVGAGDFELTQDPNTGAIRRISCEELGLTISFSNIQTGE